MNLLIIANDEAHEEAFAEHVEDVTTASIADVRIDAGERNDVQVKGEAIDDYDALYLVPSPKIAIFCRAFLETVLNRDLRMNLDPTALFILSKKSYLHQVLEEKRAPTPATAVISTKKGCSRVSDELDFPLVGKKFEGFVRKDMTLMETEDELDSFVEHMDHGSHVLVLQEQVEGDVYDCLYIDGEVISLKLEDDDWRKRRDRAKQSYHSIPSELEETVVDAAESIGAAICRVRLVDGKVVDAYLDPDLERFQKISGKNIYGKVASYLRGEQ